MSLHSVIIDFTVNGNSPDYTGHGWSRPESHGRWTVGSKAEIVIQNLDSSTAYSAEMTCMPFTLESEVEKQDIAILCRGYPLYEGSAAKGGVIKFEIPAAAIAASDDLMLDLRLPDAVSPFQLGHSSDSRALGFSIYRLILRALSSTDAVAKSQNTSSINPQTSPSATRSHRKSQKSPLAAVTMVYNEPEYLPIWLRHYSKHVGVENCFIIDHGSDDGSTKDIFDANVIRVPRYSYDPHVQSEFSSRFCSSLLSWYNSVLFCDVDEILLPDPDISETLVEYASRDLPDVLNAIGLNVAHCLDEEGDLDLNRPVTEQRRYAFASSSMCKPLMIKRDVRWSGGSHSADAVVAFRHLYLFHLRWFDLKFGLRRLARTRAMTWAHNLAGAHSRAEDDVFEKQIRGFASLPRLDGVEFDPQEPPVGEFLMKVAASQKGREFDYYNIDIGIWGNRLWRLPERFVGRF